MDSFDNFLNKINPQTKTKKSDETKNKNRERSCSSMEYSEYIKNHGPPTPVFKPLNSPNDLPPEMQLPPSELADRWEEDYRKVLSCPTELKVLVEEPEDFENDDFVLVEDTITMERNVTVSSSETTQNPITAQQGSSKVQGQRTSNLGIITKFPTPKPHNDNKDSTSNYVKRARSQSENITSYSIFKFMEHSLATNKESVN